MPRNGSGVYSKPPNSTAQPNTTIRSAMFNGVVDDIAQDLNSLLLRSGIVPMLGILNMNTFKITGLADGTADTDAVSKKQMTTAITAAADLKYDKTGGDIGGRVTIKNTASFGLVVQGLNTQYQGVQAMFQSGPASGGSTSGFGPKINFHKAGVVQWNIGLGDGTNNLFGGLVGGNETAGGSLRWYFSVNGELVLTNGTDSSTHIPNGDIAFSGGMSSAYGASLSAALGQRPPFNQATARDETNMPLGSILGVTGYSVIPDRNAVASVFLSTSADRWVATNQSVGQMAGTWRHRGILASGNCIVQRTA